MAHNQVKPSHDCVAFCYVADLPDNIGVRGSAAHSVTPHRSSSPLDRWMSSPFRRAAGIKRAGGIVDFGRVFLAADRCAAV
ncbi:hypothetical protein QA649_05605 [Bradyrhizobium sp. CB1717]|uniref:hypothetical protein n=1 Tax=Bradyrhizobium sp. CB1717 TaxID=3039154 RepID=UPI0024B27891|nr:hypothetical protein [Bradyrhizobium sp. CB1717]WFU25684.1 hypothetical protein QA649_05605 [Bradyrhizobium sp. CB1717]